MKRVLFFSVAIVVALSACVQNNGKPMPKVGDKKYYDVTNVTPEATQKMSLVIEVTDVTDSTVTVSQNYTLADGEMISNSYTTLIDGGDAQLSLKALFAKYLLKFGDSLEVVEGADVVHYIDNMDENSVFNPARLVLKSAAEGDEVLIELSVEERKVHGKEKVTTPAGTFDCIKFSENHVAKIGEEEFFTQLVCWYDIKDGSQVKQTDLTKNGDLIYEVILVKVE